jgi:hypothetical protein
MFSRLAESICCVDYHQENHPGEPERFCMGENHCAFQEDGETPSLDQTEPSLAGPGVRPGSKSGSRTNQAGGYEGPEARVLLGLHVGDYIRGDREEACAECDDHLVNVPPLCYAEEFASGLRFERFFSCLLLACRSEAAVAVFFVEIEGLKLYIVSREPGIHLDAGFNCLLITARSEVAALVGYFSWFAA